MVGYYYVKASRKDWKYPGDEGRPTDWDNFPTGKTHKFATWTKNQINWKILKVGDLIIGQSIYSSGKPKSKSFRYLPRISAIIRVKKEEHYDNEFECDVVTLKKEIGFRPLLLTGRILSSLPKAEPFKPGSNRYTITKLTESEFQTILDLIVEQEPDIHEKVDQLG